MCNQLVHCLDGKMRSATLVTAYVMQTQLQSLEDAKSLAYVVEVIEGD